MRRAAAPGSPARQWLRGLWPDDNPLRRFFNGGNMSFVIQRKKALFWALGILAGVLLMNVAWAQIAMGLSTCFNRW